MFLVQRGLNTVNQRAFAIGLKKRNPYPQLLGQIPQFLVDRIQGLVTINFWLSQPQHIKVRTMNDLNVEHGTRKQTIDWPEASYPVADGEWTASYKNSPK